MTQALCIVLLSIAVATSTSAQTKPSDDTKARLERDCADLARRIETGIKKGDFSYRKEMFDGEVTLRRLETLYKGRHPEGAVAELHSRIGFILPSCDFPVCQFFEGKFNGGRSLIQRDPSKIQDIEFLRIHWVGDEPRALFRVPGHRDNFGYWDLCLARGAGGAVHVVDMYSYGSGELWSELLRQQYVHLAWPEREAGESVPTEDLELIDRAEVVARMMQSSVLAKKRSEALSIYSKLPPSLQKQRLALVARVRASALMKGDEFERAVEEMSRHHPGEPLVLSKAIDWHLTNQRPEEALKAIDRFEESIGGDPYLHVLRGLVHSSQGRHQEAKAAYERAMEAEPSLPAPYVLLLDMSVRGKDFEKTVTLLESIESRIGTLSTGFVESKLFADFKRSSEYEAWKVRKR